MPSSKTIIEELKEELFGCVCNDGRYSQHCERCDEAIRSSMQSLLLHVMGEMPLYAVKHKHSEYEKGFQAGYNQYRNDSRAVIQSTIDSIKE